MQVLIVDDNASTRTLLTALLVGQGYEVVAALEDGNAVMDAVRRHRLRIVCLDYQLPGRNGLDILKDINAEFPDIDVLFITASEDSTIEQRAADAGAAGFLRKPFGQKQVLDELRQVTETRGQANRADKVSPAAASQPTAPRGGKRNAIIVDDNSSIRLLLKGVLIELGLNIVAQAANGEEAIKAARTHQPEILFLDVNMPILSGLEALPRIREVSLGNGGRHGHRRHLAGTGTAGSLPWRPRLHRQAGPPGLCRSHPEKAVPELSPGARRP